ncbi:MAG: enoyl-CoA hydratase/isomerase family protein [Burkholderiales bacterium]|nr:enoyl-CoA hydratase/isomerase family protein [Burkholderiales bacterium]
MSSELLQLEVSDKIATITLNRPDKHNAVTNVMWDGIFEMIRSLRARTDVSVIILKGAGKSFCVGHDMHEPLEVFPSATESPWFEEVDRLHDRWHSYREVMWRAPQPIIAQIQGNLFTIGLELAMQCDLVIAADDAKITVRSLGGASFLVHMWPWLIGVRKAKELLFMGAQISGKEAAELGMVNAAVPLERLDEHVREIAQRIAKVPVTLLALEKRACNLCFDQMGVPVAIEHSEAIRAVGFLSKESQSVREKMFSGNWREGVQMRDEQYRSESPR